MSSLFLYLILKIKGINIRWMHWNVLRMDLNGSYNMLL